MKKQMSYLLLCATLLGQSATIVSAMSVDKANEVTISQEASSLTDNSIAQTAAGDTMGFDYDETTGTLMISSGNLDNPLPLYKNIALTSVAPAKDIKKIVFTGKVTASGSLHKYFANLPSVTTIEGLENFDVSQVTDMSAFLENSNSLEKIDVSSFDTSNVTNMEKMFIGLPLLETLDLSNFDTRNVVNMSGLVYATGVKYLDVRSFDTSNVTNMFCMFSSNSELETIEGLENFNTSKVTDMTGMFQSTDIGHLDVSSFDTSNVTNMSSMFYRMPKLEVIDGLTNFNTSNVTEMMAMFGDDESLKILDLSSFDTSTLDGVKNSLMFQRTKFEQLVLGENIVIEGVSLPELESNETYTGKWVNVGTGSIEKPKGTNVWTSKELMSNYKGDVDADTYVWQKTAVSAENVTVKYVDENNEEIREAQTISGNVDDNYDASTSEYKVDIEGYTLDESKLPSNATGVLSDVAQTVTYVYTKNPVQVQGGNVTVHYQDESGKSISDDVVLKGNVGESYSSSKKDIKNYTFKEIKGSASGKFTDKAQTVTYVYKENSTTTTPSKQEAVNVYRLYNKKSMEHLYTADAYEYKHLPELSSDWVREGVNFKEYKKSDSTTVTVHRVYNPKSGEHLNTTDSNEVKVLTSKGWKSEGVAFYAPKADGKPVYRLFNPKAGIGAHFMTADSYEKSVLTKAPKEWKYEGVAWNSVK